MNEVKWGEFKIGDLFEVMSYKKRFDANKVNLVNVGGHPYIVRQSGNNGQKGYINEDELFLNEGNTISFGQDTATMFYQEFPYFTGDKIKILKPKTICKRFCKKNAQFFLAMMSKPFSTFSWGASSYSIDVIKAQTIYLPTKNNEIDFDFMEDFIAELEAERVAELEAYLEATGLKDYKLTKKEGCLLRGGNSTSGIQWQEFVFREIFDNIKQGRRLKKEDQISGKIPFVMSGTTNNGVANYVSNPVASFPKNSITIDIFGNTFYRNYDFGAGDDTGVYWSSQDRYSLKMMLFLTTSMKQAVANKFSYGHKLRSSQSLDFKMWLPVKNGQPDYEYMESYISAVQKLIIADVVKYADDKIAVTKQIVNK